MAFQETFIPFSSFQTGLYALADTTKAPWGSARIMRNMMITDQQGASPRPGTQMLGSSNANGNGCQGFFNYKRSFESDEILIRAYDTYLEGYSKNYSSAGWFTIKKTMTSNKDTGFLAALLNTDNNDHCIIGNRYDPFQTWTGSLAQTTVALLGGETTLNVDSTLTPEIYNTQTATGSSATTLTVSSGPWAAHQWDGLYVHITSGAFSGYVSPISATTTTQITFTTMGGDPGSCTFEIRKSRFPATGTLQMGLNTCDFSAIVTDKTITISSAPATANGTIVSLIPALYPANPQGNRFCNYLGRDIVVNVRSALAYNSNGSSLQGFLAGGNFYVSKITNPFDFTYSAARLAGDGDFQPTPYGGGDILDCATMEDFFYIFKKDYIESVQYSQATGGVNVDQILRVPLKAGVGSIGRVIVGEDDIYFMTPDKKFTSIGRAKLRDLKPHTDNIGITIKRLLDTYDFSDVNGIQYKNRILICCKSSSSRTKNDIAIVYNLSASAVQNGTGAFEGIWDIPAQGFQKWQDDRLFYAESMTPNIYEMFVGNSDVTDTDRYAIDAEYASHFFDVTYKRRNFFKNRVGETQQCHGYYFEGYIKGGTKITFQAWKDFAATEFLKFDFSGTETDFEDVSTDNAFLGGAPIGLNPQGALGPIQEDGRRHFAFSVFFPYQYGRYFSVGFKSSGTDLDYEVSHIGLAMSPTSDIITGRIKGL